MTKLQHLQTLGEQYASVRGHSMQHWRTQGHKAYCECGKCGHLVIVNTQPSANDIDLAGSALALDCLQARVQLTR